MLFYINMFVTLFSNRVLGHENGTLAVTTDGYRIELIS